MRPSKPRIAVVTLLALVFATPAHATHGANVFSGAWSTNIGGVSFAVISEGQGAPALQSLGGQACSAPTVYYQGSYYDSSNTGALVACTPGQGHLVGRYLENRSSSTHGDGGINLTFAAPSSFSGYYTGNNYPGQTFTYTGTFQAHLDGDGCCPAAAPPTPPTETPPTLTPRSVRPQLGETTSYKAPQPGKTAKLPTPVLGGKATTTVAEIAAANSTGTAGPAPPAVGAVLTRAKQQEERRAQKAAQLCYLFYLGAQVGNFDSARSFIACADTVQKILKRNDEIEAKRRGTPSRAAQAGSCRSEKVRGKRPRAAVRVSCKTTATGLRLTFRRLKGGPSLRSLFGRKSRLVVGRSRFDAPAEPGDRVNVAWRARSR